MYNPTVEGFEVIKYIENLYIFAGNITDFAHVVMFSKLLDKNDSVTVMANFKKHNLEEMCKVIQQEHLNFSKTEPNHVMILALDTNIIRVKELVDELNNVFSNYLYNSLDKRQKLIIKRVFGYEDPTERGFCNNGS